MSVNNLNHSKELSLLYQHFEEIISPMNRLDEILDVSVCLQKDMEALNIKYRLWDDSKGYDYDSIYFTANFIVDQCKSAISLALDEMDEGQCKILLASLIFKKIDLENKIKIHAIEPHPDDILGSALGLCYSAKALVTLHTLSRVIDNRDSVCLDQQLDQYPHIRKNPNITKQYKYDLEDLHYDTRYHGFDLNYAALAEEYIHKLGQGQLSKLRSSIQDIIKSAKQEDTYLSFPLGIEHPMHILTTYLCVEQIQCLKFDQEKILIYVDHPYDYQNVGTGRIQKAKEYIQSELSIELCRCDDLSIDQTNLKEIITEIYGERHYGEFDGSLEKTLCSYFVNYSALKTIKKFLKVHVNNILYITAQAKPFLKTGGSGEVAYGYCKALQDFVNDVRILMPKYTSGDAKQGRKNTEEDLITFTYEGAAETIGAIPCTIETKSYDGLTYYLLDMKSYFNSNNLFDSGNHGKIFALFCDAIMQKGLNSIDYVPSVLHCNDWQTALIPMLKKIKYNYYRPELKTIYTIHFYGYKGIFSKKRILEYINLDGRKCNLCITCNEDCPINRIDLLSNDDLGKLNATPSQMSFMKAGIEFADIVSTVSKGYAKELQQYPDFSNIKVIGIRNGISDGIYPFEEASKFQSINCKNYPSAKRSNKDKLQQLFGLERDFHIPLLCMVSRLTVVKGIEVIKTIIEEILSIPTQLVIIGDDDDKICQTYSSYFRLVEAKNPGKFIYRNFTEELEYQTYAGADILLMPSLSEACGTTQMIAMKYGVIPIVSMISAFADTVLDFKDRAKKMDSKYWDRGIGFYAYKDDCWVLLEVIKKAVEVYTEEPNVWEEIVNNCLTVEFGWKNQSIGKYLELYNSLT